jgi:hypothetical protein
VIHQYDEYDSDCDGARDDEDNCPDLENPDQIDGDDDGIGDLCDNCPDNANPGQENSDQDTMGNACDLDDDNDDLDDSMDNCQLVPNPDQEDSWPPEGNGIGDACECESDFDCDGDVDGTDATTFKLYFGRNLLFYPCDEINPCRGDFDCDQDCDGTDAVLFKSDFGRSVFYNSCPACTTDDWCFNSEEPPPSTTTTTISPPPPQCNVTISPSSASVYTWETVQFITTHSGDCNTPCYDWDVESSIGSTIDNTGLYTAGGSQGIDTVEVTDNCNTDTYDSAVVEVYLFPITTVPPTTTTTAP